VIWSPGLFEITGLQPNEHMTRSIGRSPIHPDDLPSWLEARQALDGRLIEVRVCRPDGQQRWVRSRMSRTSVRGNPETDFGVVQDITAEKEALEAVAGQARFISNIAARVPGLFYQARLRPDGRSDIPFVNDAVREMLELDPQTLREDARPLFQRVHPQDLPGVEAALALSARDLVPWRQIYRAVLPKRGVRWYSVEAVPQREADGSVIWHGFTTDVTDIQETSRVRNSQHRMLEAIRQAQASYIDAGDRAQVFERLLNAMLELTSSGFGFVGEVLSDEQGQPCLQTHAMNDVAWDEALRARVQRQLADGVELPNPGSLVGRVVIEGVPVLANDLVQAPSAVGLPPGHPPLRSFLGVPVFVGERLVAMVGLANRADGYTEADVDFLQPLLATLGQLGLAFRARLDRRRFQEALQETSRELQDKSRDLQTTLDAMNQGLAMVDGQGRYRLFNRRMLEMLNLPERFMASHPTHAEVSRLQVERGDFGPGLSLVDPALRVYMGRDPAQQPEHYLRRTLDGRVLEVRTRHRLDGGMVRTYSDVTSYVNGQEQLKEERQRLAWVLEATRPGHLGARCGQR
jgi:PAS domain S-box-containing protein